jgi:ABC-2 type transport system permease protein
MSGACSNIWTIAKRELSGYFASPVAYVFIVIFLLLNGFFTFMLGGFFEMGEASLTYSFFRWHPWLYLFLVPAAGMRLWAEERRQGTMELLLTMPITAWQAIVGKFLASWIFLVIALALTFPIVITVAYLGAPDMGAIFTGYIGSALLAGAYLAVTCLTSALTRNQVISFILSVVICFGLVMVGWEPVTRFMRDVLHLPAMIVNVAANSSVMPHFMGFQRGVIDSRDLLFFLSVIGFSLFCNGVVIRNLRAG